MKLEKASRSLLAMAIIATLSACGGGGGGGDNNSQPPQPTAQTGTFEFGNVEGINYTSASYSGTTNAQGQFNYKTGEQITFSVAGVDIGTVAAAPSITLFDLFNVAKPTNEAELKTFLHQSVFEEGDAAAVVNLAGLLLILDDDISIENGLKIPDFASYSNTLPPPINFTKSGFEFQRVELKPLLGLLGLAPNDYGESYRDVSNINISKALSYLITESKIAFQVVTPDSFTADLDGDGIEEFEERIYFDNSGMPVGFQDGYTGNRFQIHFGSSGEYLGTTEYRKIEPAAVNIPNVATSLATPPAFGIDGYEKYRTNVRGYDLFGKTVFKTSGNRIYEERSFVLEENELDVTNKYIEKYVVETGEETGEEIIYGAGEYRWETIEKTLKESSIVLNRNAALFVNDVKVAEYVDTVELNSSGTIASRESYGDHNLNGVYESYSFTTYNEKGQNLESERYKDNDENGVYESYDHSVYESYGEDVKQVLYESYRQTDADPEYEYYTKKSWKYDATNVPSEFEEIKDFNGDGVFEYVETQVTQLDGLGLVKSYIRNVDTDADGNPNRMFTKSFERKSNGDIDKEYSTYDSNADGTLESESWLEYDSGNKVVYEEHRNDSNQDGIQEGVSIITYQYDGQDRLFIKEKRSSSTGIEGQFKTETTTYNNSDSGDLISTEIAIDLTSDGIYDSVSGNSRSESIENDIRIQEYYAYEDNDNDGIHDIFFRNTEHFDNDNKRILTTTRNKNHSPRSRNNEITYLYAGNISSTDGYHTKITIGFNNEDAVVSKIEELHRAYSYDPYLITSEWFDVSTGEVTRKQVKEFNTSNKLVSEIVTRNVDGEMVEIGSASYIYNSAGLPDSANVRSNGMIENSAFGFFLQEKFDYNNNFNLLNSLYQGDENDDGIFEEEIASKYTYDDNQCLILNEYINSSNQSRNRTIHSTCTTLSNGAQYVLYNFLSGSEKFNVFTINESLYFTQMGLNRGG